ncbi:MAG: cell division protein FtsA [Patescibacteria group bacterium]
MTRIITGLDVGSSTVTTIVGKCDRNSSDTEIIGVAIEPAEGIRRGMVVDVEDATRTIRRSILEASRAAGVGIHSAVVSIGGAYLHTVNSRGVVAVSRADGEISHEDVVRAYTAAEQFIPKNPNREVVHFIPREFRVDSEVGIRDPIGMNGVRLEVDTLFLEAESHPLKTLTKCIEMAGIRRVGEFVFSTLAAADVVLTKKQKELGVILVDIGGGTADFVVFEEGRLIHGGSISIGGGHITKDIATGFQTGMDTAERIKIEYGATIPELVSKKEIIQLGDFLVGDRSMFPRRDLAEIIEARLKDLFELLNRELKKINRSQLLPAGVVLVGGGARMQGIIEIAKREMRLPVSLGVPVGFTNVPFDEGSSVQLAASLGLLRWKTEERPGSSRILVLIKNFFNLFIP